MSALMKIPYTGPNAQSNTPPIAGPNKNAKYRPVALRRTALVSCSGPTILCINTCDAGIQSTPAKPWITSKVIAFHSCSESVANITPQPIDTRMEGDDLAGD